MTAVPPTHRSVSACSQERVHHAFEAQVARAPDVCAVMMAGHSELSYGELNRRADLLANRLRELGVDSEVIVGICLERSIEAVTAILAVLKAGGAYLPMDPAYPAERLAYMLENSLARVLIADSLEKHRWPAGLRILHPDGSLLTDAAGDSQAAVPPAKPESDPLAYVIYTSGSTGKPKGVAMPHAPLCNLLRWQARTCPLASGSRVLQFAPLSFDVSFQEIFSTLGEGGTLVLIPETLRRDPRALLRLLDQQEVRRIFLPPVMLSQLAEQHAAGGELPGHLREIITAGEALRITPAVTVFLTALRNQTGEISLHNHYGPTETHVVTAYSLEGDPEKWPALPPIGKPIDGVRICLLGDDDLPVTTGAPGALYLGGECLARGYLHNPELTRARFVELDGCRRYKSGDIAQFTHGGDLQFLGRADDQVKIRGFRVELGEIEAALARHPAIRETMVIATPNASGNAQELTAWYIPRDASTAPASAELRHALQEHLPDYLIPSRFAAIDRLPLTPSGKVDRRALANRDIAPESSRPAIPIAPPGTPMEKMIAQVWEVTLGHHNAGVQDNFFDVGGTSLHAMQVHAKLCQSLGREFPITALFQYPTMATLAVHLAVDDRAVSGSRIQDRARLQQQQQAAARARMAGSAAGRPR